ncbi:hypothetical protein Ddye_016893 [Dipteronia dyeriana]|uniref:Uncharacterized protein n=1 Tax=Dipteronia dyeriana TaxID=168575 RepID=A0AAD9U867_9ROSI|nr:hypothetical protein Ddye_016893 [Dipteronia dyeriana]
MSHRDEIHNFSSGKQNGKCTWSAASKETEALICLNENALCSSSHSANTKTNKSCKGIKSKSNPKFSFRFQLHKEGLPTPLISSNDNCLPSEVDELPERWKTIDQDEYSIVSILEDFHGNKPKQSESIPTEVEDLHWSSKHTMAELLDGLQDNSSLLRRNSMMYTGTTTEKVNYQNLKLVVPEMNKQTIADRFQEALSATSSDEAMLVAVPRSSSIGLFGRLEQVLQSEKSIDMDFLKLQATAKPNSKAHKCTVFLFINVKILSRYLDAKLTVCRCSSGRDTELRF